LSLPSGAWDVTLRTTWVEPAYVETDASWCLPGRVPATPLGNGGAFGAKVASPAPAAARRLADQYGRPVRVLLSREDTVLLGPKRPPIAGGACADGTGVIRVARTPGVADAIAAVAPGLVVEEVDVVGPPTSVALRGAGWVEAAVLLAGAAAGARSEAGIGVGVPPGRGAAGAGAAGARSGVSQPVTVTSPAGGRATAEVSVDPSGRPTRVRVEVCCGIPLDEIVVRSYALGAAHMALGWVCSEGIAVDDAGVPQDLTMRSFGVLRSIDTPPIEVTIVPSTEDPVNGSEAVFAAVAAATWIAQGLPGDWPTMRGQFA
jgi:CO/xanthine dehydrogenase Mo-binding subunit